MIKPMSTNTMSFALPEAMRRYVDQRVRSGQYGNTSEYLRELIRRDQEEQAKKRLRELIEEGLWPPQKRAIRSLEQSLRENRPRALIQMATGSGKTYTAITAIYRLLKYADARRILFLVDTKNLGEQAEKEFQGQS